MARKAKPKYPRIDAYELAAPTCSRCRKPILGIAYRDVRVSTGPSVYDRRHFPWLCNTCFGCVSKHSTVENVA